MINKKLTPSGATDRVFPLLSLFPRLLLAIALAAFAFSTNAFAEERSARSYTDMSLKELMSLQVFSSASLIPTERSRAPGSAYSFHRRDFAKLGARRLDELLRLVPGVQLNQYRKRHNSIWARGVIDRYNNKMTLFIDGVPSRSLYYGHFSAGDNIPLENVESVEIILGPASSLYGANAFGGVISITTRDFTESSSGEISAEAGSNSRGKGAALYRDERLVAFASHLAQDAAFSEDRKSFVGSATVQPLGEDYSKLFLKAKPVSGLTLIVDYQRNNTPFVFMPTEPASFIEESPLTLAAKYERGTAGDGRVEATFHYNITQIREYSRHMGMNILTYEERQDGSTAGANAAYFKRIADSHTLTLGMAWGRGQADNMDYTQTWHYKRGLLATPVTGSLLSDPKAGNNDYAMFIQDVWNISEKLTATLGGRHDNFSAFGSYTNYRAALVWSPTPEQVVKLLYGAAIRTPDYREYLKVMEGTDFVPPTPRPEHMTTAEAVYSYHWESAWLGANFFHNEFRDYIRATPTPDGQDEYFANSPETWRMDGAELLLEARPAQGLETRLSAAYLKAERSPGGALPYLAQVTGRLAVNYQYMPGHSAGVILLHNGKRTDTNTIPADDPGPFLAANLTAFGEITKRLGYSIGVCNAGDIRVFDPNPEFDTRHNSEKTRREVWLRLEYSFGGPSM